MKYKYQYNNTEERELLIVEHSSLILIEEQNIIEGNFLIFSDEPSQAPVVYTQLPKEELDKLEMQRQSDSLITFDVLATIYDEIQLLKGGGS